MVFAGQTPSRYPRHSNSLGAVRRALAIVILLGVLPGCARHHAATSQQSYQLAYDEPLISPGTKFAGLPPAVQHTIRAEAGIAEIRNIWKFERAGRPAYRIAFRDPYVHPPLYVAADGSVLKPDLGVAIGAPKDSYYVLTRGPVTGVALSDVPASVISVLRQRAPDAEVDTITKETSGGRVVYVITFKDSFYPKLYVQADGTLIKQAR